MKEKKKFYIFLGLRILSIILVNFGYNVYTLNQDTLNMTYSDLTIITYLSYVKMIFNFYQGYKIVKNILQKVEEKNG